jgi:hypothetical protein
MIPHIRLSSVALPGSRRHVPACRPAGRWLAQFLAGRQARGVFKDQLVEGLFPQSGLRRACPIALEIWPRAVA